MPLGVASVITSFYLPGFGSRIPLSSGSLALTGHVYAQNRRKAFKGLGNVELGGWVRSRVNGNALSPTESAMLRLSFSSQASKVFP